jgi:GNAT superfamily N-acetyltransferase
MQLRHVRPSDCDRVLAVIDDWWDGPATRRDVPHVFFSHLTPTGFVLEASDGELVGVLLGFLSQEHPDEACIHMVGVDPAFRRLGFGRRLCERFIAAARMRGRARVRSVSPPSGSSIGFHLAMGFAPLRDEAPGDGRSAWRGGGAGEESRPIVFRRWISHDTPAAEAGAATVAPRVETGAEKY